MNLIEGLQEEMNKVREIIKEYDEIPAGKLTCVLMRISITKAEESIATGDVIAMMSALEDLKSYEL